MPVKPNLTPTEANNFRENFIKLLDEEHKEQEYQEFIEENTVLIPREFIQNHGLHFDLVIRKMPLGGDYITDFFYMSKSSTDWNLVCVEIEKPQSKYFKNHKGELHPNFTAALHQIKLWQAWFSCSENEAAFIKTIDPIRVPEAMRDNKCRIKYVLVHGRRSEFEGNERKKGIIREYESDDFKILSYDSLAEELGTKGHLYMGVRKNTHFEIISPHFISETIFSWVNAAYLKITQKLKDDILRHRTDWFSGSPKGSKLEEALPQIDICGGSD